MDSKKARNAFGGENSECRCSVKGGITESATRGSALAGDFMISIFSVIPHLHYHHRIIRTSFLIANVIRSCEVFGGNEKTISTVHYLRFVQCNKCMSYLFPLLPVALAAPVVSGL